MTVWEQEYTIRTPYMMPAQLVESGNRKVLVPTAFTGCVGISCLTTTRAGNASSSSKIHQAQTQGHQAPGCKDALSGLYPANHSCPQLIEGHTDE